ncbi:hypothetical protein VTL71DRAFT_997, partial [Oculimacula yallundae]
MTDATKTRQKRQHKQQGAPQVLNKAYPKASNHNHNHSRPGSSRPQELTSSEEKTLRRITTNKPYHQTPQRKFPIVAFPS